jgi:hypothetical protein
VNSSLKSTKFLKMKKTLLLASALLLGSLHSMAATGGPDAYGYTWIDSNEGGGSTYGWIDITGTASMVWRRMMRLVEIIIAMILVRDFIILELEDG